MFASNQARFSEIIIDITDSLIGMALDPRLMPGVAADMRSVRSSASTPSLRSREGSVTPIGRMDAPGGNVKVVVRVRGFLPRGMTIHPLADLSLIIGRIGKRSRMPCSDEPGHPSYESPGPKRYGPRQFSFEDSEGY